MTYEVIIGQIAESVLATQSLIKGLAESQGRIQQSMEHLQDSIDKYIDSAMASGRLRDEAIARAAESGRLRDEAIARYVESADARMKRIEENLDALIRAITAEHTNGKKPR